MSERALRLAIVGGFSSGKSALINALLGRCVAPMGVTPITAVPHRFLWAQEQAVAFSYQDGTVQDQPLSALSGLSGDSAAAARVREVRIGLPVALLKDVEIWDTPGFGSNMLAHELVARKALRDADVVVWVTPIDQALNRAERDKLDHLRSTDTPVLLVVNKADLAEDANDRDGALRDVSQAAGDLVQGVLWFSAKAALESPANRALSGLEQLEAKLADLLIDQRTRVREREASAAPTRPGNANDVTCPACRSIGSFDDTFCVCGRPLADQHRGCARCKTDNSKNRPRCRGCNLVFDAWERGAAYAARAEAEVERGLLLDAQASLEMAVEVVPEQVGWRGRRDQVALARERMNDLIAAAARCGAAGQAIMEWTRAIEVAVAAGVNRVVAARQVGGRGLIWAEASPDPEGAVSVLEWWVPHGVVNGELLRARTAERGVAREKAAREKAEREAKQRAKAEAEKRARAEGVQADARRRQEQERAERAERERRAAENARIAAAARADADARDQDRRRVEREHARADTLARAERVNRLCGELRQVLMELDTLSPGAANAGGPEPTTPRGRGHRLVLRALAVAAEGGQGAEGRRALEEIEGELQRALALACWPEVRDKVVDLAARATAAGAIGLPIADILIGRGLGSLREHVTLAEEHARRRRAQQRLVAFGVAAAGFTLLLSAGWLAARLVADREACSMAHASDTASVWASYLEDHPEGLCVGVARSRVTDQANSGQGAATTALPDQRCEETVSRMTLQELGRYREATPPGPCVSQVGIALNHADQVHWASQQRTDVDDAGRNQPAFGEESSPAGEVPMSTSGASSPPDERYPDQPVGPRDNRNPSDSNTAEASSSLPLADWMSVLASKEHEITACSIEFAISDKAHPVRRGSVLLDVTVSTAGPVMSVEVVGSNLDRRADDCIAKVVRGLRFAPALDGRARGIRATIGGWTTGRGPPTPTTTAAVPPSEVTNPDAVAALAGTTPAHVPAAATLVLSQADWQRASAADYQAMVACSARTVNAKEGHRVRSVVVALDLDISPDGRVSNVYPIGATVAASAYECITALAKRARFPPVLGGETRRTTATVEGWAQLD